MDARRFDDRERRRESDLRNVAIVMGGLLILLVGAVIFLIFSFGSRPAPVGAVASASPTLGPSASPMAVVSAGVPTLSTARASLPVIPSVAPTATMPPVTPTVTPSTSPSPTVAPSATPRPPIAGDTRDSAIAIGSVPFALTVDSRHATESATDPTCDFYRENATMWFSHTAQSSGYLGARASSSEHGTFILVGRTEPSGAITVVGCNLWAPEGGSAVRFAADAGINYVFMIGATSRRSGEIGFTLDAAPPPGFVDVAVDATATFDELGRVTITGTIQCSVRMNYVSVDVSMTQRVDRLLIDGYGYVSFESCPRKLTTWSALVRGEGYAFGEGLASITAYSAAADAFEEYYDQSIVTAQLVPGYVSPTPSAPPSLPVSPAGVPDSAE